MTKIEITMNVGAPEEAFREPNTDRAMAGVLTSVALMAGVGDPSVERPGTKRWVVRDGLGNQVGTAEIRS